MRKKKDNANHIREKYIDSMFDYIHEYISDIEHLITDQEYVLWIKRIINFIENEFPKSDKYMKLISLLKEFLKNGNELKYSTSETKKSVGKMIIELARTFKLDAINFMFINLHPKVKEASLDLFKNKHYSAAIFEAVKSLNNYVKEKASITNADLSKAMALAFNENDPVIKLNNLLTISDIDEQKGFKLLYMGAMTGIRNPKAHERIIQQDRNKTLEYLAFISLLFRRADEGKLINQ